MNRMTQTLVPHKKIQKHPDGPPGTVFDPRNGHATKGMKDVLEMEKAKMPEMDHRALPPEMAMRLEQIVDGQPTRQEILGCLTLGLRNTNDEYRQVFLDEIMPALMEKLEVLFGPDGAAALALLSTAKRPEDDGFSGPHFQPRAYQKWEGLLKEVNECGPLMERNAYIKLEIEMTKIHSFVRMDGADGQAEYVRVYPGLEGDLFTARVSARRPFGIRYDKDGKPVELEDIRMENDMKKRMKMLQNAVERCNPSPYEFADTMQHRLRTHFDPGAMSRLFPGQKRKRSGRKTEQTRQ